MQPPSPELQAAALWLLAAGAGIHAALTTSPFHFPMTAPRACWQPGEMRMVMGRDRGHWNGRKWTWQNQNPCPPASASTTPAPSQHQLTAQDSIRRRTAPDQSPPCKQGHGQALRCRPCTCWFQQGPWSRAWHSARSKRPSLLQGGSPGIRRAPLESGGFPWHQEGSPGVRSLWLLVPLTGCVQKTNPERCSSGTREGEVIKAQGDLRGL